MSAAKKRALARALTHARLAGDDGARVRIALADATDLGTDRTWLDAASIGETEKALEAAIVQLAQALDTLTPGSRGLSRTERIRRALGFYPTFRGRP